MALLAPGDREHLALVFSAERHHDLVFRWTRLGPDAARWQQAFSLDGKEWQTNWIIEHRRVKEKHS